ncbi:MAG: 16S rRNA (cytosine(967)-C(5))-methyltransferase RsmB [Gammaproteobacteria bacterium]|nr:MAG: 16S rRNA (cytosine(967)-C(5))-methyltransferase RsmB [Gammaproteobacteria bacterium]
MNPRAAAAKALTQVLQRKQPLSHVLPAQLAKLHLPRERALAQELCYGALRWYFRLETLLGKLIKEAPKDRDLHGLLLIGLYQLIYLNIPAHSAVDETVNACGALHKPWAKGLVNAVLRNYLREAARLLAEADHKETARYSHPAWLLGSLKQAWPHDWQAVAAANNTHAPMWLRVNARRMTRDDYLQKLAAAGIAAEGPLHSPHAVRLEKPLAVEYLPGFAEGWVSVQDAAAQQAAYLLDAQPGQRVLDACAAPGGKACHILEVQPALLELQAVDSDAARLTRVQENLTRLGLKGRLLTGDAGSPRSWWDGKPYERILLDAPCSGSGVIRRHPDIKLLKSAVGVAALAAQQARLLAALWPLLKNGGIMVYATCSVLPQENEQQVQTFLDAHPDAAEESIAWPWRAAANTPGAYILPGEQEMDGFYYAKLRKQ